MIFRATLLAITLSSPALADAKPVPSDSLFAAGSVLCSNFDASTRTCRTITTVTALEDGIRYSKSRRSVAMLTTDFVLETEGLSRVERNTRVCGMGPSAEPILTPNHPTYSAVLLAVYKRRRDKRIARGVCHEYRRCGEGWNVFITFDDEPEPRLVSFTTVFRPDDPGRLRLSVRDRIFGFEEPSYSECAPLG